MKAGKIILHILICLAAVCLILGIPFWALGGFHLLFSSQNDAVTSASMLLSNPNQVDGSFVVLINRDARKDEKTLALWADFFTGRDDPLIMEDITVMIADNDTNAISLGENLQARLPENQMKIKKTNGLMMLSMAQAGRFDIVLLSDAAAEAFTASTVYDMENVEVLHIKGVNT